MAIRAVIFDAFGTTVQIGSPQQPYRQLLREGLRQGRRPQPGDAHHLMTLNVGIEEAAEQMGINLKPSLLASIKASLDLELESITLFRDTLEAFEILREHGISLAICSNLAHPYGAKVKALLPGLDAYAFSYEVGATKPDPLIYQTACSDLGVHPGHLFGEKASQIAMIGDSQRCDRDGPRAIGILGFYLDREGSGGINTLTKFANLVTQEAEADS